jgi:hypothetical protein
MILTLTGKIHVNQIELLPLSRDAGTRGHHLKLYKKRSNKQLRHNFFTQIVVDNWNSLTESVVSAESVNSFKNRYDKHMAMESAKSQKDMFELATRR